MPAGELYIYDFSASEWKDAYTTYGVTFDATALSNLMAPAPLKGMIENKSAVENGKSVVRTGRPYDERTLSLGFNLVAKNRNDFFTKYAAFCSVLAAGRLDIVSGYNTSVVYHLDYLSCQSFGEYAFGIAKFVLRVAEPNPGNRSGGVSYSPPAGIGDPSAVVPDQSQVDPNSQAQTGVSEGSESEGSGSEGEMSNQGN